MSNVISKLPTWVRTNVFYRAKINNNSAEFVGGREKKEVPERLANLVSSEIGEINGVKYHYPLLDIDFEASLIPSSTPGHYHLYLKKPLKHEDYVALLRLLHKVDIVQNGIVRQIVEDGCTTLRLPHVKKGSKDDNE